MSNSSYTVQGMTCTSCAGKVTAAVSGVSGVEDTEVDLDDGVLTVTGSADDSAVRAAIAEAGYQVS